MRKIDEYLDKIVIPTFDDYSRNSGSFRHAYLTCVVLFHAVDRAAKPGKSSELAKEWGAQSRDFAFVEEVAQHLKHGTRRWVIKAKEANPEILLITYALGLEGNLDDLETHNLWFIIRAAVEFVKKSTRIEI